MLIDMCTDYAKAALSFAAASLRNPFSVVGSIIPHIIILGAFGTFVLWNNGVVLGKYFVGTSL